MRRHANSIQSGKPNHRRLAPLSLPALRDNPGGQTAVDKIPTSKSPSVGEADPARDAGAGHAAPPVDSPRLVIESIELINQLDTLGLEQVAQHVGGLLRARTPKARQRAASESDWLMIADNLLAPLGVTVPPQAAVSKAKWAAAYRVGIRSAEAYVDCMQPDGPAHRIRGRIIVGRTLLDWMRGCNVPVSFKSFAMNLQNAPTAMEKGFPGWRSAGMLGALVRQEEAR